MKKRIVLSKHRVVWGAQVLFLLITLSSCAIDTTLCSPDTSIPEEIVVASEQTTEAPELAETIVEVVGSQQENINVVEISTTEPIETQHIHVFTEIKEDATCTQDGTVFKNCDCGYSESNVVMYALGHDYNSQIVPPTEKSNGYTNYTCVRCSYSFKDNYVEKLVHNHSYSEFVVEPTCTEDGYSEHTCSCGDKYRDDITSALGHDLIEDENEHYPCESGKMTIYCTNCSYSEVKETVVEAHVFNLTNSNEENSDFVGDIESDNNFSCEVCGAGALLYTSASEIGHVFGEWNNNGSAYHYRACTTPGCKYIEAERHLYVSTKKTEPTCTRGTQVISSCVVCGRIGVIRTLNDALGHNFRFKKTIPPTDTEPGYDLWLCSRCPAENRLNYKSHIEHVCEWEKINVPATCTEPGYDLWTCTICFATRRVQKEGARGHDYRNMIVVPTCQQEGGQKMQCVRCPDFYMVKTVPKTSHQYVSTKTEIATTGWAGYEEFTCSGCGDSYKKEIPKLKSNEYPKGYRDDTCTIIIYKDWYENAYVYAAHITFTDYDRLWVECGKGRYNSGGEITSTAAKRVGAILAINGDYAVPGNGAGGYAIARKGIVYNDKKTYAEGVYNSNTGLLLYGQSKGISGRQLSELVAEGLVTDTFQFGPCCLLNGKILGDPASTSRAQRTFIGTNGKPGDIWLCVSDGRYNDGQSVGLNGYQCGAYLAERGCTLGVPLDGGGSSTIYFNGSVLNAAKNSQRAVVDFVMFK